MAGSAPHFGGAGRGDAGVLVIPGVVVGNGEPYNGAAGLDDEH